MVFSLVQNPLQREEHKARFQGTDRVSAWGSAFSGTRFFWKQLPTGGRGAIPQKELFCFLNFFGKLQWNCIDLKKCDSWTRKNLASVFTCCSNNFRLPMSIKGLWQKSLQKGNRKWIGQFFHLESKKPSNRSFQVMKATFLSWNPILCGRLNWLGGRNLGGDQFGKNIRRTSNFLGKLTRIGLLGVHGSLFFLDYTSERMIK